MTNNDFKNFIREQMFEIYETLANFRRKSQKPCILSVFRFSRHIFVFILSYFSILIFSSFHFSSFVHSNLSQFLSFIRLFYIFFLQFLIPLLIDRTHVKYVQYNIQSTRLALYFFYICTILFNVFIPVLPISCTVNLIFLNPCICCIFLVA
jgi:hypothetical protein